MVRVKLGIQAARNATAYICDRVGNHKGQGLLLDLASEGSIVLTCHHVIAQVKERDLHVRILQDDSRLGEPLVARYDSERSRPDRDAVVLRIEGIELDERPLLHKLDLDSYNGSLDATVLTYLQPNNFNAEVRPSTWLDLEARRDGWPDGPERYRLQAFRLRTTDDAREGISGGLVLCEEGVLGLVHFARAEGAARARENYLVPLSTWVQGWPALERLVEPLVDSNLRNAAKVKRVHELEIGTDIVLANYKNDLYIERQADERAQNALDQQGGVIIVGKPKSGKTRLVWQLLRKQPEALVVIPDSYSTRPPIFEQSGLAGSELVVFLDDLHRVAQTMDPLEWRKRLEDTSGKRCTLICTVRDGPDWELVQDKQNLLLDDLSPAATVFTSQTGEPGEEEGENFSETQGRQLASALKMSTKEFRERFDGTPGSLLLDLQDMKRRYRVLRENVKHGISMSRLLDSAKLLDRAGQPSFREEILRAVAEEIRGTGQISAEAWDSLVRNTQINAFGRLDDVGNVQIYRPYLEQCVSYNPTDKEVGQLQQILYRENDSDGLFYLGIHYINPRSRQYEQGIACLEQSIQLRSDDPIAWHNKGLAQHALGQLEEALKTYDTALRLQPDLPPTWINKGVVLKDLGRLEDALKAYDAALDLGFESFLAWSNKGNVLSDLDRSEGALEAYNQALTLNPAFPEAHYNKGNTLFGLGRLEDALEAYDAALGLRPDYPEAHYNKGRVLKDSDRPEEALEAYEAALSIDPDYSAAHFHKGNVLYWLGRAEDALEAYDAALGLRPDYPEAHYNKGNTLFGLDRLEDALEAYDAALRIEPNDARAQYFKGRVLEDSDRPEEALELYNRSLELSPEDSQVQLAKGRVLEVLERPEEALEAYDAALGLDPDSSQAWGNRAVVLYDLGQLKEALEACNRALILKPDNAKYWNNKGAVLSSFGRLEDALEAYDAALGIDPQDAQAHYNKGNTLFGLDRLEDALEAYNRALILRPSYPDVWTNKGAVLGNLGRREEALTWLCRAWHAWEAASENRIRVEQAIKMLGYDPRQCYGTQD